ncbi:MAG: alpha/beta hydrolase [Acidobacteriota bacterium]
MIVRPMLRVARFPRGVSALLIGICIVSASFAGEAAEPPPVTFADTPENRQLVEQAVENFRRIDTRHSRFAEINGIRMHYLEWGDDNGIPLIWSHGFSSTAYELVQVAPALAEAGYHVFSITYRGHGQTQVEDYDFSLYTIADDIAALMDHLELPCAVIGGLSLGGGVATVFYAGYPERVIAIVLEDGGSVWPQIYAERFAEKMREMPAEASEPAPPMPTRYESAFDGAATVIPMYMYGAPRTLDVDMATMFYSFLRQTAEGEWVYHIDAEKLIGSPELLMDPAAGRLLPLLERSWRSLLPEVIYRNLDLPVLLIDPTGDDGLDDTDVEENEKLADQHPEWIHHVLYPETPHIAHPNRPEWFVRDMKKLLGWIEAAGSDGCLDPSAAARIQIDPISDGAGPVIDKLCEKE